MFFMITKKIKLSIMIGSFFGCYSGGFALENYSNTLETLKQAITTSYNSNTGIYGLTTQDYNTKSTAMLTAATSIGLQNQAQSLLTKIKSTTSFIYTKSLIEAEEKKYH